MKKIISLIILMSTLMCGLFIRWLRNSKPVNKSELDKKLDSLFNEFNNTLLPAMLSQLSKTESGH
jgi:hypothetical protein